MQKSRDVRMRNPLSRNSNESLERLQAKGQDLYRQQKYVEALQYFDKAISYESEPPLGILDNRAATYSKLGRLKAALRDGKRMIELEKANASGYLRAGQVLQLLGKLETALDIYGLGLRRVPTDDATSRLLKSVRDKLLKEMTPPTAIDPFKALPLELVEMILQHFSFPTIVQLLRVSKTWQRVLKSLPKLWLDLDFSTASQRVRISSLRLYIQAAKQGCTSLHLNRASITTTEKIEAYIFSRCSQLQDINLSIALPPSFMQIFHIQTLRSLVLEGRSHIQLGLANAFMKCHHPNLERLEFHSIICTSGSPEYRWVEMPKLHTLVWHADMDNVVLAFEESAIMQIPNIRTLSLRRWHILGAQTRNLNLSHLHHLQHLRLSRISEYRQPGTALLPPILPASIESLSMDYYRFSDRRQPAKDLPSDHPNLKRLSMRQARGNDSSELTPFILPSGSIVSLDVNCCLECEDLHRLITEGALKGLEEINMSGTGIDDNFVTSLAQHCPKLIKVDVSDTLVTGISVRTLVEAFGDQLEFLGLDGCSKTSTDAVEWARSKGVFVSYHFPDLKGRRVRVE